LKILLAIFCVAAAATASAQDTVLQRHANGTPALTGRCTFYQNTRTREVMRHSFELEGDRIRLKSANDDRGDGVPDADATAATHNRRDGLIEWAISLGMVCDGPLRAYYASGKPECFMTVRAGVPTGPYTQYYPEGGVATRCTLDRGMIAGVWTRFYKSGAPYATGKFVAHSPDSLRAMWTALRTGTATRARYAPEPGELLASGFSAEGLRPMDSDDGRVMRTLLRPYHTLVAALPEGAVPDGRFVYTHRDGRLLAEIHFTRGVRTGKWSVMNEAGKPGVTLIYSAQGELTNVADGSGKEELLETFLARVQAVRRERGPKIIAPDYSGMVGVGDPLSIPESELVVEPPPPNSIHRAVDASASFPGDVRQYLANNLQYPPAARDAGIEGRVVVQFVVETDGRITQPTVARSLGHGCDEEALRIVRAMPRWKPAQLAGKPVRSHFMLPIKFTLP